MPHQHWVFYLIPMPTETLSEIQVSYKPGLASSTSTITNSQNAYEIGIVLKNVIRD